MFGGFSRNDAQNNEPFSAEVIRILLPNESDTSYAISKLEFCSKIYMVSRLAAKSLFSRPKFERKYLF